MNSDEGNRVKNGADYGLIFVLKLTESFRLAHPIPWAV